MGEISNVQKGPKEPAISISVGLGWDSLRDPWFGEKLLLQPLTSGEKLGEGTEAGSLLDRGVKLVAELIWKTRWGRWGLGLRSGVYSGRVKMPS